MMKEKGYMKAKRELSPEEKLLPYSKYYYLDLEPVDPLRQQLIDAGPVDPEKSLPAEEVRQLFAPGYLPIEFGYCIYDDGRTFMATYERLHGVTPEMLDWWFVWHWIRPLSVPDSCGNLKYKIWNPLDHWDASRDPETEKIFKDESLPISERRSKGKIGYIVESLDLGNGDEFHHGQTEDVRWEDLGVTKDQLIALASQRCKLFCGQSSNGTKLNMHYVRPTSDGVEIRTRAWTGYGVHNGHVVKTEIPPMTKEKIIKNLCHNIVELHHFDAFLPSLYNEEHKKPITY
jgi:hypothetical protein